MTSYDNSNFIDSTKKVERLFKKYIKEENEFQILKKLKESVKIFTAYRSLWIDVSRSLIVLSIGESLNNFHTVDGKERILMLLFLSLIFETVTRINRKVNLLNESLLINLMIDLDKNDESSYQMNDIVRKFFMQEA